MSILTPLYLWGAAAGICALIIIHLLFKARPVLHIFPATRFIHSAQAALRSHRRLRRWLLFLLRCLAICALGFLFARPFLLSGEQVSITSHAVIIMDTSYSMRLPTDGSAPSRHARLIRWLRKELGALDRSAFTLITDKGKKIGETGISREKLQKALASNQEGFTSTRMVRGLNLAARIINRTPASKKTLFILSDFAGPALEGWPTACVDADVIVKAPSIEFKRPLFIDSIEVIDKPIDSAYDIGLRINMAGDFSHNTTPGARIGKSGKLLQETLPKSAMTIELYDSVKEARNSALPIMAGWNKEGLLGRSMYGLLSPRPTINVVWDNAGVDSTRLSAAVRAAADVSPLINLNTAEGQKYYIVTGGGSLPDAISGSTILLSGWGAELADLLLDHPFPLDLYRYQKGAFRTGPPLESEANGRWLLETHPTTAVLSRYADGTPLLLEWEDNDVRYLMLNFQPETAGPAGWIHQPNFPIVVKNLIEKGTLQESQTELITQSRDVHGEDIQLIWGSPSFPKGGAPGIGKSNKGYIVQNINREEFAEQDPNKLATNIEKLKSKESQVREATIKRRELWPLILGLLLAFCAIVELVAGDRYGG